MSNQDSGISAWLDTHRGRSLRVMESQLVGEALQDVFGWELVQVGRWGDAHELICAGRTRRQLEICAPGSGAPGDLTARLSQLPLASDSVDAVVLPHTLEFEADPHGLLREVDRVLTGEGQLLILGFRPLSLWGLRASVARGGFPPGLREMLSERRIRDWLVLLGYDVASPRYYLHEWPWGQPRGPARVAATSLKRGLLNPLPAGAWLLRARKRVYSGLSIRLKLRERARVIGGLVKPAANRHGN